MYYLTFFLLWETVNPNLESQIQTKLTSLAQPYSEQLKPFDRPQRRRKFLDSGNRIWFNTVVEAKTIKRLGDKEVAGLIVWNLYLHTFGSRSVVARDGGSAAAGLLPLLLLLLFSWYFFSSLCIHYTDPSTFPTSKTKQTWWLLHCYDPWLWICRVNTLS